MKIDHINLKILRTHAIVWSSFILYETLITWVARQGLPPLKDFLTFYTLNICLFYAHAHLLLTNILVRRKLWAWLLLPIGIVVEILIYLVLMMFVIHVLYGWLGISIEPIDWQNRMNIIKPIWRTLYFIGFSTGYYFLITYLKEKERTTALERQRLHQIIGQQKMEQELGKAQNAYLRAQINPHFLFNTLNFIYNKTRKSSPIAADAILTLSAMMRYAVESSEEKGYILIEEEIDQVHHLIHLHKLRQNHQLYLTVEVQDNVRKLRIMPLMLITLTENIFKHGNLSLVHHPAQLKIYTQNHTLFIETDNLINAIHNSEGLHKGLENIAKRLKHNYGDEAHFSYETDARKHFKTQVQIKLDVLTPFAPQVTTLNNIDK
ncbi:hypothetical protein GCM10023231_36370 [Olivibacter ginsenosidimutans]|uniref:Signal transduction histidine kinase internal region domain-containing protein n=1 Tax=Olivibacter ginsenosidimutans TaxID=1176537 RepID=A0ABP9C588_9SPHI